MNSKRKIAVFVSLMFLALGLVFLPTCSGGANLSLEGKVSGKGAGLGQLADAAGGCPNLSNAAAVAQLNFAKEFGLDADAAAKLKSAVKASVELKGISAEIRGELKTACGNLATDLGADPGNSAQSACEAAAQAIEELKAQAGGKFSLELVPPKCSASMEAMGSCAAECDASIDPGTVDIKCEGGELSGQCDAKCTGSCYVEAGAICSGTCRGECTANFKGTCNGECDGKCDGKPTDGAASCKGRCEGSCSATGKGTCKGECRGKCELKGAATCEGACTGKCSVEMTAPRCTGEIQPPEMSAECKAECDARLSADLNCTRPSVGVKFTGVKDAEAAAKLSAALRAHLPAILKVSMGMKGSVIKASGNIKTVAEGVLGSVEEIAKGSAKAAAKVTMCVGKPLKEAVDAAADIQADVEVSVKVQASAGAKVGK
jgi:hypothetical protein